MTFTTDHLAPALAPLPAGGFGLSSVGLFRSLGGFRWEQVAARAALHCIHEGEGRFEEDGTAWSAGSGDLFLFRPGRHYRYRDLPGRPWRYDFIMLTGALPVTLLPSGPLIRENRAIWPVLEEVTEACRAPVLPAARAARLGWAVVEALSPGGAPEEPDLLARLNAIAERRDSALPTVGAIARDLGIDRSTLYRRFRAETGEPVKAWLDRKRMDRAEDLLRSSDAPVREIALICGFRDPLYFSRAFRARHGMPPGQWREASGLA